MVTADAGEDLILLSPDKKYAANQEKASSYPSSANALEKGEEKLIKTKGQATIKDLCLDQDFSPDQVVKVILSLIHI